MIAKIMSTKKTNKKITKKLGEIHHPPKGIFILSQKSVKDPIIFFDIKI
jgi:hypothetical protein